jgi:hypothetical protein
LAQIHHGRQTPNSTFQQLELETRGGEELRQQQQNAVSAMPASLLDLPREIRDQIYEYVLISPTGFIEPTLPSRSSSSPSPNTPSTTQTRFRLCVRPLADGPLTARIPGYSDAEVEFLSLSILRTCRQIYHETRGLFWEKNTFHFASFYPSHYSPGVVKTLKAMGQIPSRLITRISIHMSPLTSKYGTFAKVLQVLASRARHGSFRKLELVWGFVDLVELEDTNSCLERGIETEKTRCWEEVLGCLFRASDGCRYERVLRLPPVGRVRTAWDKRREGEDVAREMHFAFGGRLYWGELLSWEDGKKV